MAGSGWQTGSGFMQGFLGTLQGLEAIENSQMQNKMLKRRLDQEQQFEEGLSKATKDAQGFDVNAAMDQGLKFQEIRNDDGTVHTVDAQRTALREAMANLTPEQQAEALRAYGQSEMGQGAALKLNDVKQYTDAQGNVRFNNLGREATQADIYRNLATEMASKGNTYGYKMAVETKKMARLDEIDDKFDKVMAENQDLMKTFHTTLDNYGLSGVPDAFNSKLKPYGMTLESVKGKNGVTIQAKDKKGNVIGSFANKDQLEQGFVGLLGQNLEQRLGTLVPDVKSYMEYRRNAASARKDDADADLKPVMGDYYRSAIRENDAKAGYYGAMGAAAGAGGGKGGSKSNFVPYEGGYSYNTKTGTWHGIDGKQITDPSTIEKIRKAGSAPEKPQNLGEGVLYMNGQTFVPNPAKPGEYLPARGLPGSAPNPIVAAWGAQGGGQQPGAAPAAAPRSALPVSQGPQVQGRPLYGADQRELERMAKRPRGVSTAEANEAQAELDARRGEARMSAIR